MNKRVWLSKVSFFKYFDNALLRKGHMAISSILYSSLLKLETLFSRIQYDQHFFSAGFSLTNQRLFVISVILGLMALEWIFFTSRFHHGFRCNLLFNLSIRGNLVGAKDPKPIDQILAAHPCQNPQFFFLPLVCWCQHTKLKLRLLAKYISSQNEQLMRNCVIFKAGRIH